MRCGQVLSYFLEVSQTVAAPDVQTEGGEESPGSAEQDAG